MAHLSKPEANLSVLPLCTVCLRWRCIVAVSGGREPPHSSAEAFTLVENDLPPTGRKGEVPMESPSQAPSTRVLFIEDEQAIADLVCLGLRYENFDVRHAASGEDGILAAREFRPALVILDVMLPGLDGLEVCRRLKAVGNPGIIMLTARREVEDRVRGLEMGADDYLTKPFDFKELLARARALLRRLGQLSDDVCTVGDISLNLGTREATRNSVPLDLTTREFELLAALMAHPRQVLSKEALLNRVWGYDFAGDGNVVEVFISHLRAKLGDKPVQPIKTIRGAGYSFRW